MVINNGSNIRKLALGSYTKKKQKTTTNIQTNIKTQYGGLTSKPIKDEPQYCCVYGQVPSSQRTQACIFLKPTDAPGMIGLCFQEAYRDGMEMVNTGEIDGFNLALNKNACSGQSQYFGHTCIFLPRHEGDVKGRNAGIRNAVAEIDPYNPENNV